MDRDAATFLILWGGYLLYDFVRHNWRQLVLFFALAAIYFELRHLCGTLAYVALRLDSFEEKLFPEQIGDGANASLTALYLPERDDPAIYP